MIQIKYRFRFTNHKESKRLVFGFCYVKGPRDMIPLKEKKKKEKIVCLLAKKVLSGENFSSILTGDESLTKTLQLSVTKYLQ